MALIQIPVRIAFVLFCTFALSICFSQVGINTTNSLPDSSAMLDVQSTSKGMLIPRMNTAQLREIQNPAEGLMVYDTDKKKITTYSNRQWATLDTETPGRFFISDHHPDTLYPGSEYEYYGAENGGVFERYMDTFPGEWVTKSPTGRVFLTGDPVSSSSIDYKQLLYTGSSSNKILRVGSGGSDYNNISFNKDSAVLVYDLNSDSVYKEPLATINRNGGFTATIDTSNSRVFVWGGRPNYNGSNPNPYFPFDEGFIYYYNTGQKVAMDSVTAPPTYRRYGHTAVWAKSVNKLLVWGGYSMTNNFPPTNGAVRDSNLYAYDPALNTWSTLAACPLSPRADHLTVYDGNDQMITWGGGNYYNKYYDGAVYTISTNTWRMMSNVNRPDTLMYSASWTGLEMIVSNTGSVSQCCKPFRAYRYNPLTDIWAIIPGIPLSPIITYNQNHTYDPVNNRLCVLRNSSDNAVLWSYSFMNNTWSPLVTNNTSYSYRNAVYGYKAVQAGSETIFAMTNAPYYQRYIPAHFSPGLVASAVKWHYYKKK